MTVAALSRFVEGDPVHTWPLARIEEAPDWQLGYRTVGQFMTRDLFTAQPDDVIDLAANVMQWKHIRHVPVEDAEGRLVGILSHRDLVRMLAKGHLTNEPISVRDVMRTDILVTVTPETPTLDALDKMRDNQIACLPVVHGGRLVGIVTERDFLDVAARLLTDRFGENNSFTDG